MKFVVLQVYDNYIDANIMLGRLSSEGIDCWLKDENSVSIIPALTYAIGGIKLMAPETDAEKAFELLRQFRSEI